MEAAANIIETGAAEVSGPDRPLNAERQTEPFIKLSVRQQNDPMKKKDSVECISNPAAAAAAAPEEGAQHHQGRRSSFLTYGTENNTRTFKVNLLPATRWRRLKPGKVVNVHLEKQVRVSLGNKRCSPPPPHADTLCSCSFCMSLSVFISTHCSLLYQLCSACLCTFRSVSTVQLQ